MCPTFHCWMIGLLFFFVAPNICYIVARRTSHVAGTVCPSIMFCSQLDGVCVAHRQTVCNKSNLRFDEMWSIPQIRMHAPNSMSSFFFRGYFSISSFLSLWMANRLNSKFEYNSKLLLKEILEIFTKKEKITLYSS